MKRSRMMLMTLGVGLGAISCAATTPAHTPDQNATPRAGVFRPLAAGLLTYGQHEPNGLSAVNYLYGPNGTWKALTEVEYIWNYYSQYATSTHPFDKTALINYADGSRHTTTRDANGHLLLDFNNDGELDAVGGGSAFHEHNAQSVAGVTQGLPFTNFWFDDNFLARYMSSAYGKAAPNGLWEPTDYTRWRILDGNTTSWTPYNSDYFDTLALDGLYHLSNGNASTAIAKWDRMLAKSGVTYDAANQQVQYPNIVENYHLGLFKILTEQLLTHAALSSNKRDELVQHAVDQRSALLSSQEYSGATPIGWRSSITDANSLINTESVAVGALALGAGAQLSFEVGYSPMSNSNNNYFLRSYHVLSAVESLSSAGFMSYGPYRTLPTGNYSAAYLLRSPAPSGTMATVSVYDSNSGSLLATKNLNASDFSSNNRWTKVSLDFATGNNSNSLEFRIYWHDTANMDAAYIQVR